MIQTARKAEHDKYTRAYQAERYAMGHNRKLDAVHDLAALPVRGSYLDVACGRGEMLDEAEKLGFAPAMGTEVVPALFKGHRIVYGEVHALPFSDNHFDVVTMFDVIEHLLSGDDELACKELARVACKHILLTANNKPSKNHAGDELHINRRPYEEWDQLFRAWFPGTVTWIKGKRNYVSECWRVDL